jgi:hypothetical protein
LLSFRTYPKIVGGFGKSPYIEQGSIPAGESYDRFSRFEFIAHSPYRQDIARMSWIRFDFGAQPVDMGVDGMFVSFELVPPHMS